MEHGWTLTAGNEGLQAIRTKEDGMNLLAYGTLMAPDIMQEVSGCAAIESVDATLDGYRRYGVRGEQYPGIIRANEGQVEGVLYLDVPPEAVVRLDLFEGDMYSRESVTASRKSDGKTVEAMAYVVRPQFAHLLTAEQWDFQDFLKNGKQLFEELYSGYEEFNGK